MPVARGRAAQSGIAEEASISMLNEHGPEMAGLACEVWGPRDYRQPVASCRTESVD